jgi:hypothetical protein
LALDGNHHDQFRYTKVKQNHSEYEADTGIPFECGRMVDPQLRNRGNENQQPNQKILRRIRMFTGKDEQGENQNKQPKDSGFNPSVRFESTHPLFLSGFPAGLTASQPLPHQLFAIR